MARQPDDDEDQELEQRQELARNLKATKQMFFAYVPKGSLGQLVVCLNKRDRDEAAKAAKSDISGGTPVMGTCLGSLNDKIFKLDKKPANADKLAESIKRVVKITAKLNIEPDIQLKSGPIEEDEE